MELVLEQLVVATRRDGDAGFPHVPLPRPHEVPVFVARQGPRPAGQFDDDHRDLAGKLGAVTPDHLGHPARPTARGLRMPGVALALVDDEGDDRPCAGSLAQARQA